MTAKYKIAFFTIVPSPYQRDLFGALAARDEIELSVFYMEGSSPDSPWPEKQLRSFEKIMPGFWVPIGDARFHVNWDLPEQRSFDFVVISGITSLTAQWLMRFSSHGKRWAFWGERLRGHAGISGLVQRTLAAPLSRSAGIVGIGHAAVEDYRRRFPRTRHFSIPYHCDLSQFFAVPTNRTRREAVTFLFCGQMIRRKGVDLLLAAFDRLISERIEARLMLVGREADLPTFMESVSADARARIHYEGFKAPEALAEYFAAGDVFILPSRHDGWGVVVNQALAAGLPVICSDAVGAGIDLVTDGVNGLNVSAGEVESLYQAMKVTALRPEELAQWGARSREIARDLTPAAGAEKWLRVFDELSQGDDVATH